MKPLMDEIKDQQEMGILEMIKGNRNNKRYVRALDDTGYTSASIEIDIYMSDSETWTPDKKEEFLKRVEDTYQDMKKWMIEKIETLETNKQ